MRGRDRSRWLRVEPALKSSRQGDPLERIVDILISDSTAIFIHVEFILSKPSKCATAIGSDMAVTTKRIKRRRRRRKEWNGHWWSIEMRSLKAFDSVWFSVLIRVVGVEGYRRTRSDQIRSATVSLRAINHSLIPIPSLLAWNPCFVSNQTLVPSTSRAP